MLRSILSLVLGLLLFGCAPKISYVESVRTIDYSKYSRAGIFLTESNSVSFTYEPIGSLNVLVLSGYGKTTTVTNKVNSNDVIYGDLTYQESKTKTTDYITATPEKALDAAMAELKKLRADGIINLHIQYIVNPGREGYQLTGMAIKR
ncbi:MAG: hypothetical protein K2H74_08015 [Paramuribaculum sp.]|nr:hypothetical protein [Paramuribaculum sp.]